MVKKDFPSFINWTINPENSRILMGLQFLLGGNPVSRKYFDYQTTKHVFFIEGECRHLMVAKLELNQVWKSGPKSSVCTNYNAHPIKPRPRFWISPRAIFASSFWLYSNGYSLPLQLARFICSTGLNKLNPVPKVGLSPEPITWRS